MKQFTDLPLYQSHKIVGAAKIASMTTVDGLEGWQFTFEGNLPPAPRTYTNAQLAKRPTPELGWYFVEYEDGYFSFSPAETFEQGYDRADVVDEPARTQFDFSSALHNLKQGKLLARQGWNGRGMFVFLVPGSTFIVNRAPLLGILPEGTVVSYNPHTDIKGVDGKVTPWHPSQTDVMAEDWMLVEPVGDGSEVKPQS